MDAAIFEWLWFLLPVAAFSGWYVGARSSGGRSEHSMAPEYIQGLNYLLDQETGKAIEIFIKFFEVNPTTVDTHIILGNLFRQKGELEKAIRIHHNIVSRAHIGEEHRAVALLELGRDYFNAGLLDSAEKIFRELVAVETRPTVVKGYRHLLTLYEIEKSWEEAIHCAEWLKRTDADDCDTRIAHYHCELAEKALDRQDYKLAAHHVGQSRKFDKTLVRASIIRGDIEVGRDSHRAALRHYSNVLVAHPEYASALLPKVRECFVPYDPSGFADYIRALDLQVMTVSYVATYMHVLLQAHRTDEAGHFLLGLVEAERAPIPVLKIFLEEKIRNSGLAEDDLVGQVIRGLSHNEESGYLYECEGCGFETYHIYWQCPSCHAWGTARPLDVIESMSPSEVASG